MSAGRFCCVPRCSGMSCTGFQCPVAAGGPVPCLRHGWGGAGERCLVWGRVAAVPSPCAPRRYDDYDYAEVNHLLERMLKVYIKTVTCYPEKTNPEMFDRFWKQFKHSEKVGQHPLPLTARGWAGSEQVPGAGMLGGAQEKPLSPQTTRREGKMETCCL